MSEINFVRLTEVQPAEVLAHMSDPRVAEHLPLAGFEWTPERVAEFIAAKEAHWDCDGLGHWGITADGDYVGWGGFQKEGSEWDFGLVLKPSAFGLGLKIARQAMEFAKSDPRIPYVTFLLAPSRKSFGALRRMGAKPMGEVVYDGAVFHKFRLETRDI